MSIEKVSKSWGGGFKVSYVQNWAKKITEWKRMGGKVIHLTMYGLPLMQVIDQIRSLMEPLLIVVGGAKVPRRVYEMADYNVSVTSQPHSEISALALFLHELFEGEELSISFDDAKLRIVPQERGKKVLRLNDK